MNAPTCCGEPMLVQAHGVFECDICGETKTEDQLQNEAERAFEREQDTPSMSLNEQSARLWMEHKR